MAKNTAEQERRRHAARLPAEARDRVLKELGDDAAALHAHYRARGLSEQEAAREVDRWLAATPGVWRELEQIHRPLTVRWTGDLLERGRHRIEWLALLVAALAVAGAAAALNVGLTLSAPWGTGWLLLGIVVGIPLLAVVRASRAGRDPRRAERLTLLLGIATLAAPAVALLGATFVLSAAGDDLSVWSAVQMAAGLLAGGLIGGIGGALAFSAARALSGREPSIEGGGS